jgi:NitT/TauT family transport system substrate-binding protein
MRAGATALIVAALALVGAAPARAAEGPEKTDVHVGAASTGMTYIPILVAKQKKFFEDEGLTVTIAAFSGGSKALEALLGGSTDIVAGAYSNTLTMAAKGRQLVTFVAQVNCPAWIFGLAKKNEGTVKTVADLKGKRIGVSAPGSSTHMAVNYILHKAGLKPTDVSVIGVGQAAGAVAAMKAGQLDALIVNDPVATLLLDSGAMTPLAEMRTEEGNKQVFGADYPESSLYSTKQFIAKNPRTVQAVANAVVRAEKWIASATPEEVANAVPPEYMVDDKTLYAKAFGNSRRCLSQTGQLSAQGAQTVKDVLAAFEPDVGNAKIDLSATYDNSFAQKAAEKLK